MGTFLGAGLPVKFAIKKDKYARKDFDLLKEKDAIEEKLLNYIDLKFYYVSYNEDAIYYKLNVDKVNACLKEFLEEIYPIMNLDNYLLYNLCHVKSDEDDDINTVLRKELERNEEEEKRKAFAKIATIRLNTIKDEEGSEEYYLGSTNFEDRHLSERYTFFDGGPWLLDRDRYLANNVRVAMLTVDFWINFEKIFSEDETVLLMLLNRFSKSYFKSELSKIMIFHITQ